MKNNLFCRNILALGVFTCVLLQCGCKKFLSEKNSKSLEEPNTLMGLQALLDFYYRVNNLDVGYSIDGADNFYYSEATFNSMRSEQDRNRYIWTDDNVIPTLINGYAYAYDAIYRANTAIEGLNEISRNDENAAEWDNIKGQALYLRGKSYFALAQVWTLAYDRSTANADLGMPLRLSTDFNEVSVRGSNEATYRQIIKDLKGAIDLLPEKSLHPYRSSRPAALGLLARTYLSMRKYDSCFIYVDNALGLRNTLLDYNTLDTNAKYPFHQFGVEVIMDNIVSASMSKKKVDSVVFNQYEPNDLRKVLFFNSNGDGSYRFSGSYEGTGNSFGGVATDELFLMRAECEARLGHVKNAKIDMKVLLENRYASGTYKPIETDNPTQVLKWILLERRKELIGRALRWTDIKRLNKEGANISLKRVIGEDTYILPPNDPRFAMAFPDDVIEISGMQQNPR